MLHIGNTPARFDAGWADAGWDEPDGAGTGGFLRFANSQRTQAAQTFIAAMVFGGAFTRNPGLTVVLAELWASWLPWFVSRLDMAGRTTIIIAHRPATIALADRVVILEHGRVAEHGTHDELLMRSERYRGILAEAAGAVGGPIGLRPGGTGERR